MIDNDRCYKELLHISNNVHYYKQMMSFSPDEQIRMFYENLLNNEIKKLKECQWYYYKIIDITNQEITSEQRVFTQEELAEYDGSGGKPAYVAVNGIVYDVSLEATWGGSTHFNQYAGKDLTLQFNGCHGGKLEILRNLPQVGVLNN